MAKKITLYDESGQPLPSDDGTGVSSLPPGVEALIETRINSAIDNLREHNNDDLQDLARDHARKWRWLAFVSSAVALVTIFYAPQQVVTWIGTKIDQELTEPMLRNSADRLMESKMTKFVSDKLAPLNQQAEHLKTTIDEINAVIVNKQTMIEDQQNKLSSQINELTTRAQESLSKIESTNEFTTLVTKAQNDDRSAFDQILLIYHAKGPFQDIAVRIVEEIALDFSREVQEFPFPSVKWERIGIDPNVATLEELKVHFGNVARAFQPAYLNDMWRQDRFTKAERLQFLYDVIGTTNSLRDLEAACLLMNTEARIGKIFLDAKAYQKWWEQNKSMYTITERPK
jgi:hypothetical protein